MNSTIPIIPGATPFLALLPPGLVGGSLGTGVSLHPPAHAHFVVKWYIL